MARCRQQRVPHPNLGKLHTFRGITWPVLAAPEVLRVRPAGMYIALSAVYRQEVLVTHAHQLMSNPHALEGTHPACQAGLLCFVHFKLKLSESQPDLVSELSAILTSLLVQVAIYLGSMAQAVGRPLTVAKLCDMHQKASCRPHVSSRWLICASMLCRNFLLDWDRGFFSAVEQPTGYFVDVVQGAIPPELTGTFFRSVSREHASGEDTSLKLIHHIAHWTMSAGYRPNRSQAVQDCPPQCIEQTPLIPAGMGLARWRSGPP